ncbi:unnamed protein product [Linum trigynum]|uniref:Uncharacterized protein n=1 Tax=Linum trigynum TaxID=586398 RepID=A0AAV2CK30_9ROSI
MPTTLAADAAVEIEISSKGVVFPRGGTSTAVDENSLTLLSTVVGGGSSGGDRGGSGSVKQRGRRGDK